MKVRRDWFANVLAGAPARGARTRIAPAAASPPASTPPPPAPPAACAACTACGGGSGRAAWPGWAEQRGRRVPRHLEVDESLDVARRLRPACWLRPRTAPEPPPIAIRVGSPVPARWGLRPRRAEPEAAIAQIGARQDGLLLVRPSTHPVPRIGRREAALLRTPHGQHPLAQIGRQRALPNAHALALPPGRRAAAGPAWAGGGSLATGASAAAPSQAPCTHLHVGACCHSPTRQRVLDGCAPAQARGTKTCRCESRSRRPARAAPSTRRLGRSLPRARRRGCACARSRTLDPWWESDNSSSLTGAGGSRTAWKRLAGESRMT